MRYACAEKTWHPCSNVAGTLSTENCAQRNAVWSFAAPDAELQLPLDHEVAFEDSLAGALQVERHVLNQLANECDIKAVKRASIPAQVQEEMSAAESSKEQRMQKTSKWLSSCRATSANELETAYKVPPHTHVSIELNSELAICINEQRSASNCCKA